MKLTLGYSPCPNDCFIFDALVHNKIDCEGIEFEVGLHDVETLNQKALTGELDITKLSFHAFGYVLNKYILLRSGSALGFNCGPILIQDSRFKTLSVAKGLPTARQDSRLKTDDMSVAIPGKMTTANFLLTLAYPNIKNKVEFVFNEIEDAVLNGKVDAGLIIHENRFTYQQKGLEKIVDLGEYWDSLIHAPIPLGGIVAKRNFDNKLQQAVNRLIKKSVEFAFINPESCMSYVKKHAQEMDIEVIKKHIDLYVNKFSVDIGDEGIKAINLMFNKGKELKLFDFGNEKLIID